MSSKLVYYVKVGNLYLSDLHVNSDEPHTYFIRSIDLNCSSEMANKYNRDDALQIKAILKLINIDAEIEEIFEIIG